MKRASDKLWSNPAWSIPRWGKRRGKPWTDNEMVTAQQLRQQGASVSAIAIELGRSVKSIEGKIGYEIAGGLIDRGGDLETAPPRGPTQVQSRSERREGRSAGWQLP